MMVHTELVYISYSASARDFETYLASFLPPIYLPDTMVMDPTAQNVSIGSLILGLRKGRIIHIFIADKNTLSLFVFFFYSWYPNNFL